MSTYWKLRCLVYGAGMSAGALALAWFLNSVFERYFPAIALILLAMLTVTLIRRMVEGGIPEQPLPNSRAESSEVGEGGPDLHEETKHLTGVDRRYGWMALPPAVTAFVVLASVFV